METTQLDAVQPRVRLPECSPEVRSLGRLRLLRQLGDGGMASVFLAYDEEHNCHVALKVLASDLTANKTFIERFYREARHGSSLQHPNLVRCLEAGYDATHHKHYLVMEHVDGASSLQVLEHFGKLKVGDAIRITLDIARALQHAHARNIIHRDIKPGNILITRAGVSKLADLGLAKRIDEVSQLTGTKQGLGTPHYMPYEQAMSSRNLDGRSDIFALGATLYHLVTGELPFAAPSSVEVTEKKALGLYEPASVLNPAVPVELDRILAKMLAKDRKERFGNAEALIEALEQTQLAVSRLSFLPRTTSPSDPWLESTERVHQAHGPHAVHDDMPTLLDVHAPKTPKQGTQWYLQLRVKPKGTKLVKGTTEEILLRLQDGRLKPDTAAGRRREGPFRPLRAYPEFREVLASQAQSATEAPATPSKVASKKKQTVGSSGRAWLAILGLVSALCVVLWLMLR